MFVFWELNVTWMRPQGFQSLLLHCIASAQRPAPCLLLQPRHLPLPFQTKALFCSCHWALQFGPTGGMMV